MMMSITKVIKPPSWDVISYFAIFLLACYLPSDTALFILPTRVGNIQRG